MSRKLMVIGAALAVSLAATVAAVGRDCPPNSSFHDLEVKIPGVIEDDPAASVVFYSPDDSRKVIDWVNTQLGGDYSYSENQFIAVLHPTRGFAMVGFGSDDCIRHVLRVSREMYEDMRRQVFGEHPT